MRVHDFPADAVYPTGLTINNTPYGSQVTPPIPKAEEHDPNFRSDQCDPTQA